MNFYKHHIGDFDQATRHLSFVEDAAYSRCIRKYYAEERPLPVDIKAVQRLIGARTKEEKEAVQSVLEEFFTLESDGWHNKRCDAEIARADAQAEANRKVAHEREERKRARLVEQQSTNRSETASTNRQALVNESSEHSEHESFGSREPSQTPDSRHQTPDSNKTHSGGNATRGAAVDNSATPLGDKSPQRQKRLAPVQWWKSDAGIALKATELGIPHASHTYGTLKDLCFARIKAIAEGKAA